ncbi:sulfatase-like hydrolase/transferase [Variovorax sp. J2P1-59]|uniref:sulfatase-like hydrolase/transferase n=1 Tax=Variovorax flavidus TaxID=3053501 RepID=UPI002578B094|nr:sulfatase-like hydrolase/transferase [Variovorax sp. J2P1-59]MDM0076563.1 sulfatase-like hydrolase/transferase [Variovorax sp. J2P1-59]
MTAGGRHPPPPGAVPWPGWARWLLRFGLPFVVLDAMFTLENIWPTLWARPGLRLSFELCMAALALTAWLAARGTASARMLRALALLTTFWVVTRYVEVTASAVFGRQINLYWDGRHLFDVLRMGNVAGWQIALGAAVAVAVVWLVYRIAHRCWAAIARELAWRRPRPAIGVVGVLLLATFTAHGMGGRDTRWFFSMPVTPIIARQAGLLAAQLWPDGGSTRLSPSPTFDTHLGALGGADVLLIFAESYGVTTLDDPAQAAALAPHRARLAEALRAGGRQVVSARVRSPTYGGASWLAHAELLSGVDMQKPGDYELLLATQRPTLVRHFKAHGYRTVSWMPGLQRPWPEGSFYAFDRYVDANNMGYGGPGFGHWRIPDQASVALMQSQELAITPAPRAPRLIVFPTLASHAPFRPLAPYVPDWDRLLGADAFTPDQVARAVAEPLSWLEPVRAYLDSLAYTFEWLGDYLSGRAPPNMLTIVIGDHQPMASVSGRGASWDVPVHIISDDPQLLKRFEAAGFTRGLLPMQASTMSMHGLTSVLLHAFDDSARHPAGAAE